MTEVMRAAAVAALPIARPSNEDRFSMTKTNPYSRLATYVSKDCYTEYHPFDRRYRAPEIELRLNHPIQAVQHQTQALSSRSQVRFVRARVWRATISVATAASALVWLCCCSRV